jgi:hypothetical protein
LNPSRQGNITFTSGVFTWFHLTDGGLPPNCWAQAIALAKRTGSTKASSLTGVRIGFILMGENKIKKHELAHKVSHFYVSLMKKLRVFRFLHSNNTLKL